MGTAWESSCVFGHMGSRCRLENGKKKGRSGFVKTFGLIFFFIWCANLFLVSWNFSTILVRDHQRFDLDVLNSWRLFFKCLFLVHYEKYINTYPYRFSTDTHPVSLACSYTAPCNIFLKLGQLRNSTWKSYQQFGCTSFASTNYFVLTIDIRLVVHHDTPRFWQPLPVRLPGACFVCRSGLHPGSKGSVDGWTNLTTSMSSPDQPRWCSPDRLYVVWVSLIEFSTRDTVKLCKPRFFRSIYGVQLDFPQLCAQFLTNLFLFRCHLGNLLDRYDDLLSMKTPQS